MKNIHFFLLAMCLIGTACKGNETKREVSQPLEMVNETELLSENNSETEECVNPCNDIIGQWKLVEVSIYKKIIDYSDENIIYDFQFLSDKMLDYNGQNIYKVTEGTLVITGTIVDDIHNLQEGTYSYEYSCRIGGIIYDKDNPNVIIEIDDFGMNLKLNNQRFHVSVRNDTMIIGKGQESDGFRFKTFIKKTSKS